MTLPHVEHRISGDPGLVSGPGSGSSVLPHAGQSLMHQMVLIND